MVVANETFELGSRCASLKAPYGDGSARRPDVGNPAFGDQPSRAWLKLLFLAHTFHEALATCEFDDFTAMLFHGRPGWISAQSGIGECR